jgi:hypothetical protein
MHFFSLTIFSPWSVIGVFFLILVTLDLCLLLIHRYLWKFQKWQILISVNRDLDFFNFLRFMTEMSNLYRGPSYQVSVHLAKWFQRRRFFRIRPIRNKNCLWHPCLLAHHYEMSNLHRAPSIHAAYQVSVHLVVQFQRRRFFYKSANRKQELPVAAMFVNGSGRNEKGL